MYACLRWNAVCIAFDVNIVDVSCSESPDFRILLYTEGSIALRLWRRVLRPDEKGRREVHLMWKVRRGERGKRLTKGLQRLTNVSAVTAISSCKGTFM